MANDTLLTRIARVDPVHAETMRANPTEFVVKALPFYRRFRLVRAAVSLRHKPVEFRYLDDGMQVFVLGGQAEHIYQVNKLEGLSLTPAEVPSYARFFLENGGEGKIRVVEGVEDLWRLGEPRADSEAQRMMSEVRSKIHPVSVERISDGLFAAKATVFLSGHLGEIRIEVAQDGGVTIGQPSILVPDLPLPAVGR